MKKPRIDDFDPNAAKLASPLDGMPAILPAAKGQVSGSHESVLGQSTDQSINQSTEQSINQLPSHATIQSSTKILEKPRGFYITDRLDKRLDEAVRYFKEQHGIKKADRSTIVNAVLDNDALWTEDALDRMVEQVITQLTKRLMG
jgi:hypothetical protein